MASASLAPWMCVGVGRGPRVPRGTWTEVSPVRRQSIERVGGSSVPRGTRTERSPARRTCSSVGRASSVSVDRASPVGRGSRVPRGTWTARPTWDVDRASPVGRGRVGGPSVPCGTWTARPAWNVDRVSCGSASSTSVERALPWRTDGSPARGTCSCVGRLIERGGGPRVPVWDVTARPTWDEIVSLDRVPRGTWPARPTWDLDRSPSPHRASRRRRRGGRRGSQRWGPRAGARGSRAGRGRGVPRGTARALEAVRARSSLPWRGQLARRRTCLRPARGRRRRTAPRR